MGRGITLIDVPVVYCDKYVRTELIWSFIDPITRKLFSFCKVVHSNETCFGLAIIVGSKVALIWFIFQPPAKHVQLLKSFK